MIRIFLSRSVYATISNRPASDSPRLRKRVSLSEWSGSEIVSSKGSANTVMASAKLTPCLARFVSALVGSHSKTTRRSVANGAPTSDASCLGKTRCGAPCVAGNATSVDVNLRRICHSAGLAKGFDDVRRDQATDIGPARNAAAPRPIRSAHQAGVIDLCIGKPSCT